MPRGTKGRGLYVTSRNGAWFESRVPAGSFIRRRRERRRLPRGSPGAPRRGQVGDTLLGTPPAWRPPSSRGGSGYSPFKGRSPVPGSGVGVSAPLGCARRRVRCFLGCSTPALRGVFVSLYP